jgi:hypothetical protein
MADNGKSPNQPWRFSLLGTQRTKCRGPENMVGKNMRKIKSMGETYDK